MPGVMNQYPDLPQFRLAPDLSAPALETTLGKLLVPGVILDQSLERRCRQLDERFQTFVACCPVPEWSPGLQITAEIRRQHETYLPLAEIKAAFAALCARACRYEPLFTSTPIATALSWPDALARLQPLLLQVNPGRLLRRLAAEEEFRFAFLAALFIPKSFGNSFNRYPLQAAFLRQWLASQKQRLHGGVAILDAACGSGEGTYETAATVMRLGFSVRSSLVAGITLEPLELAAAAHGWFPQDGPRSAAFREQVGNLCASGAANMIHFSQGDICCQGDDHDTYDVVTCNGLLGGPLLHGKETLAAVIGLLVQKLNTGGILLAADHFHEGWKQKTPPATLVELLAESGLQTMKTGEGVGGVKTG